MATVGAMLRPGRGSSLAMPSPQQLTSLRAFLPLSHQSTALIGRRPGRGGLRAPAAVSTQAEGAAVGSQAAQQQRPGNEYFASDRRPVILFDGVCNLCNGGVNFMLDWDKEGRFRMAALQSAAGRKLLQRSNRAPDDISSIVLVEPERSYIKSEAVLRIAQGLNAPLALLAGLAFLVPRAPADLLYDQVADNRYRLLGYRESCRLGDDRFSDRFLSD